MPAIWNHPSRKQSHHRPQSRQAMLPVPGSLSRTMKSSNSLVIRFLALFAIAVIWRQTDLAESYGASPPSPRKNMSDGFDRRIEVQVEAILAMHHGEYSRSIELHEQIVAICEEYRLPTGYTKYSEKWIEACKRTMALPEDRRTLVQLGFQLEGAAKMELFSPRLRIELMTMARDKLAEALGPDNIFVLENNVELWGFQVEHAYSETAFREFRGAVSEWGDKIEKHSVWYTSRLLNIGVLYNNKVITNE